ncbi:glycerophosphodiester phosphodiesterase [Actinopolymorpha alba]|uniref:glycerophosphodiester phosphodiesterase n=1 Tax=Actinopolymorpha alba TaxID=533267 RepID=UPI00036B77B6|nr:glycerophosphodiester phosphodiesterase family protein [Actinopolymorpha alba]
MRITGIGRAAGALLFALSLAAPATAIAAGSPTHDVDVIAHRGSSAIAPENTEAAVKVAIKQRADFVEIDVQRTKDGHLVNFHDCTMVRTTDVEERFPGRLSYRVSDFTWAEIRTLDAGSWFHESYAGEPIISVRDLIRQIDGKIGLLAEISPCGHYEGLAEDFAAELRSLPRYVDEALADSQLAVQSFKVDDAKAFHAQLPDVPIGILNANRPTDAELVALSAWADQVNLQWTVTDEAMVTRIHQLGMETNAWTVNEAGPMRNLIKLGVDGIITDIPQSLTQR